MCLCFLCQLIKNNTVVRCVTLQKEKKSSDTLFVCLFVLSPNETAFIFISLGLQGKCDVRFISTFIHMLINILMVHVMLTWYAVVILIVIWYVDVMNDFAWQLQGNGSDHFGNTIFFLLGLLLHPVDVFFMVMLQSCIFFLLLAEYQYLFIMFIS